MCWILDLQGSGTSWSKITVLVNQAVTLSKGFFTGSDVFDRGEEQEEGVKKGLGIGWEDQEGFWGLGQGCYEGFRWVKGIRGVFRNVDAVYKSAYTYFILSSYYFQPLEDV